MATDAARAIVEAEEYASTSAGRMKQALARMGRLQWRDSTQGQLMAAVREALERRDMDALGEALEALEASMADDECDHDALEAVLIATTGALSAAARHLGPLAGTLEDGRYLGGLAPIAVLEVDD